MSLDPQFPLEKTNRERLIPDFVFFSQYQLNTKLEFRNGAMNLIFILTFDITKLFYIQMDGTPVLIQNLVLNYHLVIPFSNSILKLT